MNMDSTIHENGESRTAHAAEEARRERSTIEFPYMDLNAAIEVAKGIFQRCGPGDCQNDELAAQLELSPTSSGFRSRIAAARIFGLINSPRGSESVSLTDLGRRIIDTASAREAKAEAFLKVELFRTVYETFRGQQIPPPAALERQMRELGVSAKQTERARQLLERSAESAGFYESGRDRLVRPALGAHQPLSGAKHEAGKESSDSGGDGGGGNQSDEIDPIIKGLLARLPKSGEKWPRKKRELWLDLLRGSFDLIYEDEPANETRQDEQSNEDER